MALLRFLRRLLIWLLALIGLGTVTVAVILLVAALRFEKRGPTIANDSVLVLDLAENIVEEDTKPPFAPWVQQTSVTDIVFGLDSAAADPRIKALVIKAGRGRLDMALAQEIRSAVKSFRESGKPAYAFAESFGEGGDGTLHYYVAAATNKIFLQPSGEVRLMGFSLESPFIKEGLDLIGVEARVGQRREYKGVPYMFTETSMPEPMRRNMQQLADSWLAQLTDGIADDRKTESSQVRRWVDEAPWDAVAAEKAKMVDALAYWDQAREAIFGSNDEDKAVNLRTYAAQLTPPPKGAPRIAVVYGLGPVLLGNGEAGPFDDEPVMASEATAKAISDAVDDHVSAILFRVDSPGGSYVGADQIWREVDRARSAGIPVIVSMGGAAASGGYFVAAPAAKIVAQPGTITGSIGVFAGKPILAGLWQKLGIAFDGVQAGNAAGTDSLNRDFSPEEWQRLERRLDVIYGDFVGKVAKGRALDASKAEAAAKGQIWSGADAKARGLVDELGGYVRALELAREQANLQRGEVVNLVPYPAPKSPIEELLSLFKNEAEMTPHAAALSSLRAVGLSDVAALARELSHADSALVWMPPIMVNGQSY